jgi:hypothetical protein
MEELLKKAKIDYQSLKYDLNRTVAFNLSSLTEPCFYPDMKKKFYDFLAHCKLTEQDMRDFTKRRWKGTIYLKYNLHIIVDPITNFYIFLMQYFLKKRDASAYKNMMLFHYIRDYANLMNKGLKNYCNPDAFKYALEILTKNHLFIREGTIGNALYYLSMEGIKQWTEVIEKNDLDGIAKFISGSRHRVSQSLKSFLETYYQSQEEGSGFKPTLEPTEDEENLYQKEVTEKVSRQIENVIRKLTVYKTIDIKAQEESRDLSKINASLATSIASGLGDTKYIDNVRIILKLFSKNLTAANQLCGKPFYDFVRTLMSIKRTRSRLFFKQQINILLLDILSRKRYRSTYEKLTPQTQFLINLYLAYYITISFRNTVC